MSSKDTATVEVGRWAPGIEVKEDNGNSKRMSDFQFLFEACQEESMHGPAKIKGEKTNDKPQLPDGANRVSKNATNGEGTEDRPFRTSAGMNNRVSALLGGVEAAEVHIGNLRFPVKLGQRTIEALKASKAEDYPELALSQGRRVRIDSGLQGFIRGSKVHEELPIDDFLQPATGRSGRRRVNSGLDGMFRSSAARSDRSSGQQGRSRRTKAHSDLGAFYRSTSPGRIDPPKIEGLGIVKEK